MNSKTALSGIVGSMVLLLMAGCPTKQNASLQTQKQVEKSEKPASTQNIESEKVQEPQETLVLDTSLSEEKVTRFAKPGKILVVNLHGMDENEEIFRRNFAGDKSRDVLDVLCKVECKRERFIEYYPKGYHVPDDKKPHKRHWFDMVIGGNEFKELLGQIINASMVIAPKVLGEDGGVKSEFEKELGETAGAITVLVAEKEKSLHRAPSADEVMSELGSDSMGAEDAMMIIRSMWSFLGSKEKEALSRCMGDILSHRIKDAAQRLAKDVETRRKVINKSERPENKIPKGNIVIIGYSQGAMVAWALANQIPSLAVIGVKGSWVPGIKGNFLPKSAYVIAGEKDEIFSPEVLDETVGILEKLMGENKVIKAHTEEKHEQHDQTRVIISYIFSEISRKLDTDKH